MDRRIPEALSSVRFSRIRQALKGWPFPFLALADITISPDVRGISRPSAFAVLRLILSSYLIGW